MSRLAIPIHGLILWSTGDLRLWVELELLLKDNAGNWTPFIFRVDTATDITTFPAFEAKRLNLPMPQRASGGARHSQTGLEICAGLLRFRIAGLDLTEYAASCFFLGDPHLPTGRHPGARPRALLQPLALLDNLRIHFDKNGALGAQHGEMILEKK